MGIGKEQIRTIVGDIRDLPTIPSVGTRIIELASDPDVSIDELSEALHQDPSLAARVLKIANSPFYGTARHVDTLQLAVVILGLNEIRNIALGVTFFNSMKNLNPNLSLFRETFWHHSAACGVVARILGRKLEVRCEGTDFIAGLLHDMGKIVIDTCFDGKFVEIFNKTYKHKPAMLEAEEEILGDTHEEFGSWLAEKWHLPQIICDAISYHHKFPSVASLDIFKNPKVVSIAYISEAFCEHYEIGWDGDFGNSNMRNERAWDVLLSGQKTYTMNDVDTIITETMQVFNEAQNYLLWE